MRVLQSCASWLPTTERWLWVQVAHLPHRIASTVITARRENVQEFPWPDVSILAMRSRGRSWPRWVRRWLRKRRIVSLSRERGARLVHSHYGPIGWEDLLGVRDAGLKHVVTFYGYDVAQLPRLKPIWGGLYADLFRTVDRVLCEGPYMAHSVARLGCPEEKLRVQRLGVELERIPFVPRRLGPDEPLRVLMAAAFVEKKGIPFGIRALGRIAKVRPVRLTLIGDARGKANTLDEKRRILEAIADQGLERDARLLGFQPHQVLQREMAEHHLFLQPSVHAADGDCEGGAPVGLIEAAAGGMAVVSTTHCDIPEVVVHEQTGWLAPERDVDALEQGLRWWLDQSSWERALASGRERIKSEFDADRQGERLAAIYGDVVESPE